jgi:CheY-like chemotaxis protein
MAPASNKSLALSYEMLPDYTTKSVRDVVEQRISAANEHGGKDRLTPVRRCSSEAIAILEARHDIHAVLTNIQMPGSMDGQKLARFIRGRWPLVKIVVTSGFVNVSVRRACPGAARSLR